MLFFVHRVNYAPFLSQCVHLFHDAKRFFMWHHRRFEFSGFDTSTAFKYLIFITVYHVFRFCIPCYKFVVSVNFDYMRAIDVVNTDIAFCSVDYALTVVQTETSGLEVCHLSVCEAQ